MNSAVLVCVPLFGNKSVSNKITVCVGINVELFMCVINGATCSPPLYV